MISRDPRQPHPSAPLPGTTPPRRGLFIDRWGTLLELPPRGFRSTFADAELTPGAQEALFRASQSGWQVYLIGNEPAVAKGRMSDASWKRFEADLLEHLTAHGVPVQRNYACLDDPEAGKGRHRRDSVFFLPNTGAMYHACQHDGIRLDQSWVIGDSTVELAAGWRAGCRLAAVRTGLALGDGTFEVDPWFEGENLAEALGQILAVAAAGRR